MIQPNELRLLNWVKLNDEDLFCKVLVIDNFGLSVDIVKTKEITWIEYEQFSPVELTPDILEAAGFTNGIKTIETSFLETEFYVDLMDGDAGFNKHGLWFPCKHLHQLQNLYWCLCGDELQIDITKLNK